MKTLIILALGAFFAFAPQEPERPSPDSFTIDFNQVADGIRTIEATPSRLVCPKKVTILIEEESKTIKSVDYVGGCNGNLKAIRALLVGQTVDYAIEKLSGIECGKRPTSCTDQLARILKKVYSKE